MVWWSREFEILIMYFQANFFNKLKKEQKIKMKQPKSLFNKIELKRVHQH